MGVREYDHEPYSIEDPVEIQRIKLKREKDEKELNDLCKNICLLISWSLVLILIIYIFFIMMCGP